MKSQNILVLLSAALLLIFSSCSKEEEEQTNNNTATEGDIKINFEHSWNDNAFMYNSVYDINGTDVKFQEIRYYLSNFAFTDNNANTDLFSPVFLINAGSTETETFDSEYNRDNISNISFLLGLDSLTNHADPTVAEAPLNDGTMHWGWDPASGYKFIKIEGEADANGDGVFEAFSIHAATDPLRREILKTVSMDTDGKNAELSMKIDYSDWFQDVDFSQELSGTHGSSGLTHGIADRVEESLSIE